MSHKVAMLFPGQGVQYVGMCKELYEESEIARETFRQASEVLRVDLAEIFIRGRQPAENTGIHVIQPVILTACIAYYRTFLNRFEIEPVFAAGHSLGEYSALTAAGGIDFKAAVALVEKREGFMNHACAGEKSVMAAIMGVSAQIIEAELSDLQGGGQVYIANYNSLEQTVIAGIEADVDKMIERLEKKGASAIKLNVNIASHCPLMKEAAACMEQELENYDFFEFHFPVMSNVTAAPHHPERIKQNLARQMVSSVRWVDTIKYLMKNDIEYYVEAGPGTVLKKLNGRIDARLKKISFSIEGDRELLNVLLQKKCEEKDDLEKIKRCYTEINCTRNLKCGREKYEENILKPAAVIKNMYQCLLHEERQPAKEELNEAFALTNCVFQAKGLPKEECETRWNSIMS